MQFSITPEFSSKVFTKVGQMAGADIDFSNEETQVDFCIGFIDSLRKEAGMTPEMAVGFMQYICEAGAAGVADLVEDKTASEEVYQSEMQMVQDEFARLRSGIINIKLAEDAAPQEGFLPKAVDWAKSTDFWKSNLSPLYHKHFEPMLQRIGAGSLNQSQAGQNAAKLTKGVNDALKYFKDIAGETWEWLKNRDNISKWAPALIGGIGLPLAYKAMNPNAGIMGMGAAAIGGAGGGALLGNFLANNSGKQLTGAQQAGVDQMRKANSDYVNAPEAPQS